MTGNHGRWTAELPKPEGSSSAEGGIVMFVPGARINQSVSFLARSIPVMLILDRPLGPLAPGAKDFGTAFERGWAEASKN